MKIRTVEFVETLVDPAAPFPGTLPQVAFAGRSNVGKSSLINTLLRRTNRKIARVSGEPGKTRALNFFQVNDRFFLVDLPGYGFAKVPAEVREGWRTLIEGYLAREDGPRAVVHLVDARRTATDADLRMLAYLSELGIPALVILTKMDKLNRSERAKRLRAAPVELGLPDEQIIPFSSKTGEGREDLLEALDELLTNPSEPESAPPSDGEPER